MKKQIPNLELPRKVFHIFSGLIYLLVYLLFGYTNYFITFSIIMIVVSFICIKLFKASASFKKISRKFSRPENPIKGIGISLYLLGSFIAISLQHCFQLPVELTVYALVTLATGDGLASIVGKRYPNIFYSRRYEKSYFATIVAIIFSVLICLPFLYYSNLEINISEIIIYTSIGMIIELKMGSKKIRKIAHIYCLDNFTIPIGIVVTGPVIYMLFELFTSS